MLAVLECPQRPGSANSEVRPNGESQVAKSGLFVATLDPVLRDKAQRQEGWALCIGAGTSLKLFPSWAELVRRIAHRDGGDSTAAALDRYFRDFSPDAILQAAVDRLGGDESSFAMMLAEDLYRDFRQRLTAAEWTLTSRALAAAHMGQLNRGEWLQFLSMAEPKLSEVSALGLARTVADTIDTKYEPTTIVSFNAEPLFSTMLNAFVARRRDATGDVSSKDVIDRVTHSISYRFPSRLPHYFCHGLLPVPDAPTSHNSIDKLVFSEGQYLQLANNAFSWQSASFIQVCMTQSIVFVGVSLSDPNMRRWLSWVHATRMLELKEQHDREGPSTTHFWLNVDPGSSIERAWIESTVAHLGVRLVWLPGWSDAEQALRRMLGLPVGGSAH
jgi:hypothetical protein